MQYVPLAETPLAELEEFFSRVPQEESDIFKINVADSSTLAEWKRQDFPRLVMVHDEDSTIIGTYGVMPDQGWSSHVGKVLVLVDPRFRGQGLGRRGMRVA